MLPVTTDLTHHQTFSEQCLRKRKKDSSMKINSGLSTYVENISNLDSALERMYYYCLENKRKRYINAKKTVLMLGKKKLDHAKFISVVMMTYGIPPDLAELLYQGVKEELKKIKPADV